MNFAPQYNGDQALCREKTILPSPRAEIQQNGKRTTMTNTYVAPGVTEVRNAIETIQGTKGGMEADSNPPDSELPSVPAYLADE